MFERTKGEGGVIAISKEGEMGIGFNSDQMSWAYARDGILHYGVDVGEDFHEEL